MWLATFLSVCINLFPGLLVRQSTVSITAVDNLRVLTTAILSSVIGPYEYVYPLRLTLYHECLCTQ